MHDLDPVFERFTYTPELAAVAADLGLPDALGAAEHVHLQAAGIGGEVGCHQDATFLYTDPMTVTGFWFAIEDATLENGCLWAAPGGHRQGGLRQVFKRDGAMTDDDGTVFEQLDPTPLPDAARRPRAAARAGRHAGRAARSASALERPQPLADQPPRLLGALHRRLRRLSRVELAAAPGRHAPPTSGRGRAA